MVRTLTLMIPTFERANCLARLLSSIQVALECSSHSSQIEIVVSDNGSEDDTKLVCESFAMKIPNFRFIRRPVNLGFSRNFVETFLTTTTDYVWSVGDDEIILPDSFDRIYKLIESRGVDIALLNYSFEPDEPYSGYLKSVMNIPISTAVLTVYDFCMAHGWLWSLGNLGMVVVRRDQLFKVDPTPYVDSNFVQAAWYLEAHRNGKICFDATPYFRTFIESQTSGKDRWKDDGTLEQFLFIPKILEELMEREVIPSRLPKFFMNFCSQNDFPVWMYYLQEVQGRLSKGSVPIPTDYWNAIRSIVCRLDNDAEVEQLLSELTSLETIANECTFALGHYIRVLNTCIGKFSSISPRFRSLLA
jgi:glycosyltransferase involved in cell wall biosynthesis